MSAVHQVGEYLHTLQREARFRQVLEEMNLQIETLMSERSMNLMALTVADRVRNPAVVIALECRRLLRGAPLADPVHEGIGVIAGKAAKLETADFDPIYITREHRSGWDCPDCPRFDPLRAVTADGYWRRDISEAMTERSAQGKKRKRTPDSRGGRQWLGRRSDRSGSSPPAATARG